MSESVSYFSNSCVSPMAKLIQMPFCSLKKHALQNYKRKLGLLNVLTVVDRQIGKEEMTSRGIEAKGNTRRLLLIYKVFQVN